MKRTRPVFLAVLLSLLSYPVANSHHAMSPVYDATQEITIEGIVTEFRLVNPHAMITMDVLDEAGNRVTWAIELAGRLSLSRHGWTEDTVSLGERLTATGNPTHSGSPKMYFTRVVLEDGTEMLGPGAVRSRAIEEQRRQRARERDRQN